MNTPWFRLVPGILLLVIATVALRSPALRASVWPMVPALPIAVLGGGILLGWRFGRSRLALALLLLLLADQALLVWASAGAGAGVTGRIVFNAVAVLLPLNLAALSWLPERGVGAGRAGLAIITAQALLVALLCQPLFAFAAGWLERSAVLRPLPAAIPQAALLAFAVAFVLVGWRAVVRRDALESGALWTLAAAFLALRAGEGGLDSSVYFATGGAILIVSLIETWYGMAYGDELTGLPGRRALDEALARLRGTYTIAMADIDHFKKFNDTHGHAVGDQLLRMVGARLAEVGGGGRAFRYGGEEFALLFPGSSAAQVMSHLETLRKAVGDSGFTVRGPGRPRQKPETARASGPRPSVSATISIGVAEAPSGAGTPEQVLKAADAALYRAKRAGRNRVST